jgi:hypothetical protein
MESKVIVGSTMAGVRQVIANASSVDGVAPEVTGPPVILPLDGAHYASNVYSYADVQPECLIGDVTDIQGHCFLKAIDRGTDAEKMTVCVLEALAASVEVVGQQIKIYYVDSVTVYSDIVTMLNAHALLSVYFQAYLPAGGAGASLVTEQTGPLYFTQPAYTAAVQDKGGLFQFLTSNTPVRLRYVALECGVGSTVDVKVSDALGTYTHTISTGLDGDSKTHSLDYPILSGELIQVIETVSGVPVLVDKHVTLYVVKDKVV